MKTLKRIAFLIFVSSIVTASTYGQKKLQEVDLKVNGIGSGSSYSAVLAKFGKPTRQTTEETGAALSCMASDEVSRALYYPGLKIELLKTTEMRKFAVVAMTVSSARWSASGVRAGSTLTQVMKRFGKPISIDREAGKTTYFYVTPGNLGSVNFEFSKGRLVSIVMSETLC
ncbi:MAG TPA: hypothetical protein VMZ26_16630 [Pyrinomonadaceae bacterium]|nr:hypothetical protein [Pyrinomonadaceae bacterium]